MIHRFVILSLLAGLSLAETPRETSDHLSFTSVVRQADHIVATLPEKTEWWVSIEAEDMRPAKPRESFRFRDGDSLTFFIPRGIAYKAFAHLAPVAGLEIYVTDDGKRTNSRYFIEAK